MCLWPVTKVLSKLLWSIVFINSVFSSTLLRVKTMSYYWSFHWIADSYRLLFFGQVEGHTVHRLKLKFLRDSEHQSDSDKEKPSFILEARSSISNEHWSTLQIWRGKFLSPVGGMRRFGRELATQLYKGSEIVCCCVSLVVDINCHRYEPMPYQLACLCLYRCLQDSLMKERYHPCQIHTIFFAA